MSAISIFIPAYNAERHLAEVVSRIPPEVLSGVRSLWIINDGSKDNTTGVIKLLAKQYACVRPIHFPQNRGYGAVVKEGFSRCREDGCDFAICLHSDGQYPPESIPTMLAAAKDRGLDIVQGSRHAGKTAHSGGMPAYKIIAGRMLTALENRVFGLRMTDYHSGFLCYSRRLLATVDVRKLSNSFDIDLEIIASARANGLAVGEIPIPTRYADEVSYLNPVSYGFRVLGVVGKYALGRYR